MVAKVPRRYLLLGLSFLGIVHLLDLLSTIIIVNSTSAIYAGENHANLTKRWHRSIKGVSLKRPLVTSSGIAVTAAQVSLVFLGNVLKWVTFIVYLYDCKKRLLEKKVDVEKGSAVEALK